MTPDVVMGWVLVAAGVLALGLMILGIVFLLIKMWRL